MGSSLVNYYRKKDEKDEHVPKVNIDIAVLLINSFFVQV